MKISVALLAVPVCVLALACESDTATEESLVAPPGPRFAKPVDGVPHNHGGGGNNNTDLITEGEVLFFGETFDGNGRTCGTCHRAENNMTIDVLFIATLKDNDPLFVAEDTNLDLKDLESGGPDGLLRMNGLILENIQGFGNPPVFRAPPSLFNLSFTAPYGLSGDFANLRDFTVGAVRQHFPKTLTRAVGADFRLPTEHELDALEAFMLSLESPADGNFKVSGPNSILSTPEDPRAKDTERAEVQGRDLFSSVGCASCHKKSTKVFSGNTLDTGVELLNNFAPEDTGDGSGRFQTPGLFGLRKAAFFHNNAVGNTGDQFDNLLASVAFYDSPQFKLSDNGTLVTFDVDSGTKAQQMHDIARFLEAISQ